MNNGFKTEQKHYKVLVDIFGKDNVSEPKNASGGSDFIIIHDSKTITVESKNANTDIFDLGVVSCFSNGMIYSASQCLSNTNITQLESSIKSNINQVIDYCNLANTNCLPHRIHKELYNDIKLQKKLIHIKTNEVLYNSIQNSFIGKNKFHKANYICIGDNIFTVCKDNDPFGLIKKGSAVLNDNNIDYCTVRTARSGSSGSLASVCLRVQYRLKKQLPETKIQLTLSLKSAIRGYGTNY